MRTGLGVFGGWVPESIAASLRVVSMTMGLMVPLLALGCHEPSSAPCEGLPGHYCKQGYVCTKKAPFACILEGDKCGDGQLDDGEQCDDGNRESGDGCSSDCKSTEVCGNAVLDNDEKAKLSEECDPAESDPSVGPSQKATLASRDAARCDRDCTVALCGDGHTNEVSEQCDPRKDNEKAEPDPDSFRLATEDSPSCNKNCTRSSCGDGVLNTALEIEDLGLGKKRVGELCDPGTGVSDDRRLAVLDSDTCDKDCTKAECGDGYQNAGEECDRSRQVPGGATWSGPQDRRHQSVPQGLLARRSSPARMSF